MAVVEYGCLLAMDHGIVFERSERNSWPPYRTSRLSRSKKTLEDEISALRDKMEHSVLQGNPLSSERVVKISAILDEKINQYMKETIKR